MSAIVRTARNTLVDIGLINLAGALVRSAAGSAAVAGSAVGSVAGSVAGIRSFESSLCVSFWASQSAQSVCPPSPGDVATCAWPTLSE